MKNQLITKEELGKKIKQKYPQYKDMSDLDLAEKILIKYPEYSTKIKETQPSFLSETGQDIKQIGTDIKKSTEERVKKYGETTNLFQKFGQGAGYASDIIGAGIKGVVKSVLPQSAETAIKTSLTSAIKPITESDFAQTILSKYNSLPEETKKNIDASLGIGSLALDLTGIGLGAKGTKQVVKTGAEMAGKTAQETAKLATGISQKGIDYAKEASKVIEKSIQPKSPTALEAMGKVLQGETKDVKEGIKALSVIDSRGIKTFKDLKDEISGRIKTLSLKVDSDLAIDNTTKKLKNLILEAKTTSGKTISINPVRNAIKQLGILYKTTGDVVSLSEIKDLANKAIRKGLTNLEINNLARKYGSEFSEKAFSKTGEALTSVNSQMYENTRKAIKKLARSGIKGSEAQKADSLINSLYNTNRLVKRNIEAVNKITQKISERGLLEKVGYNLSKYGDILTGGTLRGLVGGLLPRGVGNKVWNALDVEKALEKNLDVIQKAIKSGDNKEIVNILKNLGK